MKRTISALTALTILFLAGRASAVPTVWTDTYDPTDVLVNTWAGLEYTHDITDNGFVPSSDSVNSATLQVNLRDDGGRCDWFEVALINQPGIWENGQFVDRLYNFNFTSNTIGVSLSGIAQLNSVGTLTVRVQSVFGDFYFDQSILTASGDDNSQQVPEPATLLLLGAGLLGLGLVRRKTAVRGSRH